MAVLVSLSPSTFAVATEDSLKDCSRHKSWRLMGLHPMCAVLFTVGYAMREYGSYNYMYDPNDDTPLIMFILSQVCIFVCP